MTVTLPQRESPLDDQMFINSFLLIILSLIIFHEVEFGRIEEDSKGSFSRLVRPFDAKRFGMIIY